jgi:hypothetical protein
VQLAILLLLVVALGLLILGLIASSSPLVVGSILISGLAAYLIVRSRRAAGERAAANVGRHSAEPTETPTTESAQAVPSGSEPSGSERTESRTSETGASETGTSETGTSETGTSGPEPRESGLVEPEPAASEAPLRAHGSDLVWVVDGRPRYHLERCGFISGLGGEPVPLQQAVEDGFTPCSLCDPDTVLQELTRG